MEYRVEEDRGRVVVTLDGEDYPIRFDHNTIVDAESAARSMGIIDWDIVSLARRLSLTVMRLLYWVAIKRTQPKITQSQIGELLYGHDHVKLWQALNDALGLALEGPQTEEDMQADDDVGQKKSIDGATDSA